MLRPACNQHGLPLLGRVRPRHQPIIVATPPRITCSTPDCQGLALHRTEHGYVCDDCQERQFDNMIWRTS